MAAPDGQIAIAAIPGQSLVRLSQSGSPLSLDIQPLTSSTSPPSESSSPAASVPTAISLPELLTGGEWSSATGASVNEQGQVVLTGSGLAVEPGDVAVRGSITGQAATLEATHNLTLAESNLQANTDLNLLAQNTVRVRDSVATPFGAQAGGNLLIRGNQGIDILALNHPGTPFQSGRNLTLVSNGVISGDARFASQGQFSVLTLDNTPGNLISLYDPIISADGDVTLGDYTGAA
ncbi:MAG TPA: hypothetical protein V6D04_12150, partial [Candidatus Obscuribacterales bacterium]